MRNACVCADEFRGRCYENGVATLSARESHNRVGSEIEASQKNNADDMRSVSTPELAELNGTISGEIAVTGSLQPFRMSQRLS